MLTARELNVKPGDVLRAFNGKHFGVYDVDGPPGIISIVPIRDGRWAGFGTIRPDVPYWSRRIGADAAGLEAYRKSLGV